MIRAVTRRLDKLPLKVHYYFTALICTLFVAFVVLYIVPTCTQIIENYWLCNDMIQKRNNLKNELSLVAHRNPASELQMRTIDKRIDGSKIHLSAMLKELIKDEKFKYFEIVSLRAISQPDIYDLRSTIFQLQIESTYLNVGQFIEKLENSSSIIDVQDFAFDRIAGDLQRGVASIQLSGLTGKDKL